MIPDVNSEDRPAQETSVAKTTNISGKWRIIEMDLWDQVAIDLLEPAFIEFEGNGGPFRFMAVDGWMDCRHGQRNGWPYLDFTWDGTDECDHASGRGWVTLQRDGSLNGHIYFHHGDDPGFKAIPFRGHEQPPRSRARG